jgi:predicted transcriptional regulator of viral defense system
VRTSSTDLRSRRFDVAADHGGYFTAAQARDVGYSYQAQAHHVAAGNWQRIDRGIFRLAHWVPDLHDDLARWSLWARGRGVISHDTALGVHEIGELESPKVHLVVPVGFRQRDDAVVLHIGRLTDQDVQHHTGFRVTTPLRSLIDVATEAPDEDQLARAIEEARRRGLVVIRELRSRSEQIDPRAVLYVERALQRLEHP